MVIICASQGCDKPVTSGLACPNCKKLGLDNYFCTQECFKKNYATHKKVHAIAKQVMAAKRYVLGLEPQLIGARNCVFRKKEFSSLTGRRLFAYPQSTAKFNKRWHHVCFGRTRRAQIKFAHLGNKFFLQRITASCLVIS